MQLIVPIRNIYMNKKIYFHEDDYCMIEILPADNYEFCEDRATQAKSFSEKHRAENGFGWTDMFLLKAEPKPLKDLQISVIAFENALSQIMERTDVIYTGYSDYEEKCEHTMAFFKDNFHVFYESENGIIEKIWFHIDIVTVEEKAFATTLLRAISQISDLILVDNYKNQVLPLNEEQAINDYLHYIYVDRNIVLNQGSSLWGKWGRVDKGEKAYLIICFTNSDLIEITGKGIKYRSFAGNTSFIDFENCAENYFTEIKEGTKKCVGERDIAAEQPFIEFCTLPVKTRMLFVNTSTGLFKKWRNNAQKQFQNIYQKIIEAGFTTFDLS